MSDIKHRVIFEGTNGTPTEANEEMDDISEVNAYPQENLVEIKWSDGSVDSIPWNRVFYFAKHVKDGDKDE